MLSSIDVIIAAHILLLEGSLIKDLVINSYLALVSYTQQKYSTVKRNTPPFNLFHPLFHSGH